MDADERAAVSGLPDDGLVLSWSTHGTVRVLSASGALTVTTAAELHTAITGFAQARPADITALVVDLTAVGMPPAAGVEALRHAADACAGTVPLHLAAGGALRESTGVADPWVAHDTASAALAAITGEDETMLLRTELADRDRLLASLPVIEQAKGMLRHAFGFSDEQAVDTLTTLAQETGTTPAHLAHQLIQLLPGALPGPTASLDALRQLRDRLRQPEPPASDHELDHHLSAEFAELTRAFLRADTVLTVLEQVLAAAYRVIPGVRLASITVRLPDGRFHTPVETHPTASILDQVQYDTGKGPCLDVARPTGPDYVRSDELATEPAWPGFATAAADYGYSAVLSIALLPDAYSPEWTGALNLYGCAPAGLSPHAHEPALLLATHASLALAHTEARTRGELHDTQLRRALQTRDVIGQAKGILMQRRGYTATDAFNELRRISQDLNIKLADVAETLATRHTELDLPG